MKKIFLILFCAFFISCKGPSVEQKDLDITSSTIIIDGCEYLAIRSFYSGYFVLNITHKGNCKNPIHRCK